MSGILDYLKWRGDVPFDISAFNDVDMVILCEISYLPLEGIVSSELKDKIPLKEAARRCIPLPKLPLHPGDQELSEMLAESKRFGDLQLSGFVNIVDDEKQFCALTFEFGWRKHAVVFKGTDNSLIGWKEDLDLSYSDQVPSQKCAVDYIEKVYKAFHGTLMTAGHSKGGNLSVYGSAFCSEKVRRRISQIYNLDGPGFNDKLIVKDNFREIMDRTKTFVPQDSIVGLLLEHKEPYTIISSIGKNGLDQHSLFTWEVNASGIEKRESLGKAGNISNENIDEWIGRLTYEQKKEFVETLYELARDRKTIENISARDMIKAYYKLDKDKKHAIGDVVGQLGSTIKENIVEYFKEKANK
ncbi:MAG: DUF2974 domain-containing protein [Lachnospiraceae bacterium]|nr:DUF2974 domain-containing protein [Lachnospiraceae bacterium]MBR6350492.1 DUF2974 domain-containing protein [Lachnospiraceae bacterium]